MGTIVSRLELDHPLFLEPGTTALHAQIEGLYTSLGDHVDTRFFRVLDLANAGVVTLRHNFQSPFGSIFVKIWALNEGTGQITEADQTLYTIAAGGSNPDEEIDITNNSGGEVDIAVTIFGSNQRLDELLNVDISGITTGQVLSYNTGTKIWTPTTVTTTVAALTDTTISAPAEGDLLHYDFGTSKWVNAAAPAAPTVVNLTDTNISGVADGEVLTWDNGTSKWVNAVAPSSGQTLYDKIIDASGSGDYTSIRTAILAEPNDTTFYVRNGSYSESNAITIKLGQKLIGETADGVILTCSVVGSIFTFSQTSPNVRGQTNRLSTNYDWDSAANIGLLTVTASSATATYSGSLDPVTNDIAVIGPGLDKYDLVNVDGGTNTVTLDRPWRGVSGVVDWDVWHPATDANWKMQTTEIRNMTVIGTSTQHDVFSGNRTMNCLVDNIKIQTSNTTATAAIITHDADTIGNIYSNIESTGEGAPFVYVSNTCSFSRSKFINIRSHGHSNNRLNGSAAKPFKYQDYHFNSISSGTNFWSAEAFGVHNIYKYDFLSGATNFGLFGTTSSVLHFGSQFYFGIVDSSVFRVRVSGAQLIVSIKNGKMSQNVEIKNIETTLKTDKEYFNILTESFLKCPINVTEANLVVSGSVIYGGKIGAAAFAQNNGFDHTL